MPTIRLNYRCPKGTVNLDTFECPKNEKVTTEKKSRAVSTASQKSRTTTRTRGGSKKTEGRAAAPARPAEKAARSSRSAKSKAEPAAAPSSSTPDEKKRQENWERVKERMRNHDKNPMRMHGPVGDKPMPDDREILKAKDVKELLAVADKKISGISFDTLEKRVKDGVIDLKNAKDLVSHVARLNDTYPIVSLARVVKHIGLCNEYNVPCKDEDESFVNHIQKIPKKYRPALRGMTNTSKARIVMNPTIYQKGANPRPWNEMTPKERRAVYENREGKGPRWGVSSDAKTNTNLPELTLTHEFGHALFAVFDDIGVEIDKEKLSKIPEFKERFKDELEDVYLFSSTYLMRAFRTDINNYMSAHPREFEEEVSKYGSTDTEEAFAEMFTLYTIQPPEERGPAMKIFAKYADVLLNPDYYVKDEDGLPRPAPPAWIQGMLRGY